MLRFVLPVVIVLVISTSSDAATRGGALQQRLQGMATQVRDFFRSSAGRHAGWQQTVAGIAIAGLVCTSLSGCAVKHSTENKKAVQAWQETILLLSSATTLGMLMTVGRETEDWERDAYGKGLYTFRYDPRYLLIPVSVFFADILWMNSTVYVKPEEQSLVKPQEQDALAQNTHDAQALQAYLREHLTPPEFHRLAANSPNTEDTWVAIPTTAEYVEEPQWGLVKSIENAEAIYYGKFTEGVAGRVLKLDAVKHTGSDSVQPLPAAAVFVVEGLEAEVR